MTATLHRPHHRVVTPSAELDLASSSSLAEAVFVTPSTKTLVIDLSRVTFCDSSGIDVLVHARDYFTAGGGALVLWDPSPAVRRILSLTGLDACFAIVATDPDAPLAIELENRRDGLHVEVVVHQALTSRVLDHLRKLTQVRQPDVLHVEVHGPNELEDPPGCTALDDEAAAIGGVVAIDFAGPCARCLGPVARG